MICPRAYFRLLWRQIARISADVSVCPVGLYKLAEEEGTGVVLAEDFVPPTQAALTTPAGWCHRCPPLRLPGALHMCLAPGYDMKIPLNDILACLIAVASLRTV